MKRKGGFYGAGKKGAATRLHSEVVRARGACERCGSTYELQTAHIIRRNYCATRTDENGAWCLCAACHRLTEDFPDEFMALVKVTIGMREFDELKAKARASGKFNDAFWQSEIDRLTQLLAETEQV